MKERPILLNTDMVKAVLDGRKVQTRRPITPQPRLDENTGFNWKGYAYGIGFTKEETNKNFTKSTFPLGKIGDRLWVRETFATLDAGSFEQSKPTQGMNQDIRYKASESLANESSEIRGYHWKPSIHMPRWVCRLVLEITAVRLERVQNITKEDSILEGCSGRGEFRDLWLSLYPKTAWDSLYSFREDCDDWVWVIDFKVVEQNGKVITA